MLKQKTQLPKIIPIGPVVRKSRKNEMNVEITKMLIAAAFYWGNQIVNTRQHMLNRI